MGPPSSLVVRIRAGWARRATVALAVLAVVGCAAAARPAAGYAADPCTGTGANPISCENSKPGTPLSDWEVTGAGDPSIRGFATSMSVDQGGSISFKIKTDASSYHIDILRLGYYGGDGARKVVANLPISASLPQSQPACMTDSSTGLIDCGNWSVSATWNVPADAVSGVYIAHLVRDDTGGDSQIPFVVRDDSSHSAMLVQTSDATWQAYNAYGGNSLYSCTVACPAGNPKAYKPAYAVSYNRPFDGSFNTDGGRSYLFYAEYQMIRFLEENGYDASYTSQADVERRPALLLNHQIFLASGHDEYWSGGERAAVEAARDAGVNLAFFTGNEVFWKTRWTASSDGSDTPYRTLITYKETHFDSPVDPAGPETWTGSWIDPRFSPPGDGGRPPNALTGQLFLENSGTSDITVPAQYAKLRFWRNTPVASLTGSQSITLGPGTGTLGYEWDEDVDNGFRPAGLFDLSSTTVTGVERFTDYGTTTVKNATGTHNLTLYRARSGALVFGAGTVQWSWGLDDSNVWRSTTTNPSGNPPDPTMQQATVNLFADMGAQPATLLPGLAPASASTDTLPPTSSITSPTAGASLQDGDRVTISGTAADLGGVVAGVEVSTDGGRTWHPARGTSDWTYSWDVHGAPTATVESRAVDDSGNLQTALNSVEVDVSCPCSLWGSTVTPDVVDAGDGHAVELGVKFRTDTFGVVTGIRFYKAAANTGTHIGSLWTADGQRLARATFTNESASGWQSVDFSTPIAVQPNTTYVASYYAPAGHFSASQYYFNTPPPTSGSQLDSPPLHAVPGSGGSTNGLYAYGLTSTFPTSTFNSTNYWVDVEFAPAAKPGQVTGVTATAGAAQANVSWTAPSSGGPATTYTVTPYIGSTPQTPTTVGGDNPPTSTTVKNLTPGTTYTFTVTASNPNGSGPESAPSNAVTPVAPTAPAAPTGVVARSGTGSIQVSWSAPSTDGGSPITGYTVTPAVGGSAQTPIKVGAGATSTVVGGLTTGTRYTFTVNATNAIGTSADSAPSNAAAPANTILDFAQPGIVDTADNSSVVLGVKFRSDVFGLVTGVRFYKSAANTGTHVGALWTVDGTLLASATFTNESASGWQQVEFDKPVIVTAGTTYVAGYLAPKGRYSSTTGAFASAVDNPPLHALANSATANGVYVYAGKATFPTNTANGTSYSVDVMFTPSSAPGPVSGVTATAKAGSAAVSWNAPTTGGPVTSYTVTPYVGSTADTADAVTLSGSPPDTSTVVRGLTGGTTYTFQVQAANPSGAGPPVQSNSVTPTAATAPSAPTAVIARSATASAQVSWTPPADDGGRSISGYTITPYTGGSALAPVQAGSSATSAVVNGLANGTSYTFTVTATNAIGASQPSSASNATVPANTVLDFGTPTTPDSGDPSSVVVGVKFQSDVFGTVTGLRFYKSAANTGTHVGSLWTTSGTLLSSATFTGESASGWQQVDFAKPIAIDPNTTYIASYLAPRGHYSNTTPAFSPLGVDNAPLHALANSTSTNGVYTYSSTNVMPTSGFNATNYWVDVLFKPQDAPGAVSNVRATAGPGRATVTWNAPTSGGPVTSYVITPYDGSTAQPSTTIKGSPPDTSATIQNLTPGTAYTFTVQAVNAAGAGPVSSPSNAVTPTAVTPPGAPTGVIARSATTSAQVSWTAPADGGSPITGYTVTPMTGGVAQTPVQVGGNTTSTIVSGLTNGTSYTFRVSASNAIGTGSASSASNAVAPRNTIFDFATPAKVDSGDTGSVVVGVKFRSDVAGTVTGLRFYKAAANTGTHVGSLWSATGTLLASATFTGESASGWQQVDFSTPVSIAASTTYVAGYLAPVGRYSTTSPAFSTAGVDNGPLHALANSISPNGVYAYSRTSTFPTNTSNASNYWVDVLFAPGT